MIKRTVFFSQPAWLSTKNEQLVIQLRGSTESLTVPIEDLGYVVLEHPEISLSQAALTKLLANNVALVSCDATHKPNGLWLPLDGHTLQAERFAAQITASVPLKKQLWQQTIQAKILNQAFAFEHFGKNATAIRRKIKEVRSGDPTNEEGQAARLYWAEVFEPFTFFRERFGLPPNNLLNYGYAIIRAAVARALVGSGLLPTLGIHHHNRYNAFALADDIMEPYRPYVDALVRAMVMESETGEFELTKDRKAKLLNLLAMDVVIEHNRRPMMLAMGQTAVSLVKCYLGEANSIVYPVFR